MRDRYRWFAAAVIAVAITFSASIIFVSAQGAQSKAPAPTAGYRQAGEYSQPAHFPAVLRHLPSFL